MKTLTRIQALFLAMLMMLGAFSTTAFAAEAQEENTVVKGEVVNQEVLPDGMIATTVEYTIEDASKDAILEFSADSVSPRLWDQTETFEFSSGSHNGAGRYFSEGKYLGFEVNASSANGYNKDQSVSASLRVWNGNGKDLGTAVGHTINKSENVKADWISISNTTKYFWKYTSNNLSLGLHPINVSITYYTWN